MYDLGPDKRSLKEDAEDFATPSPYFSTLGTF